MALYRRHDPAAQAKYQDLRQLARTQRRVLAGTPGTLKQRTQAGKRYWVREFIRPDGRKTDDYLGPAASIEKSAVERLAGEIELAGALAAGSASLRLFGYQRIERKPAAVLAAVFNRGLFAAGLALVGSHAYGVLLNECGVSAPGYATQDVDLARGQPLAVAASPDFNLQTVLEDTGLAFVAVPGLPSHRPSASYKLPGAETLVVDLLVSGAKTGAVVAVQELGAHAQAVPLLDFLVDDALDAVVLSPNQVIPVRVPTPERFVLHKMFASQSRSDRSKVRKDLDQAAVLAAVVEEDTPGRLRDAFKALPAAGRRAVARAVPAVSRLLEKTHPQAREILLKLASRESKE